jgi:hypothetical protein
MKQVQTHEEESKLKTSEAEKWNNLFLNNLNSKAQFLLDKWGLPITRIVTEQPALVEQERLKRQQSSQQTRNSFLSGDPFLTFNPTPKTLCNTVLGRAKIPQPLLVLQMHPVLEVFKYSIISPTPPSSKATTATATSRTNFSKSL